MASTSKAMMVSNGQGATAEIYDPETDLSANYGINIVDAKMENDGKPTSFYVVYDQLDFGQKEGSTTKAALVPSDPLSGSSEKVKFNFVPKSAQGFDVRDPGIVLFEHPGYKGNARQFRSSRKDVTEGLPATYWSGVSSFIVTGGSWKLYGNKNFKPPVLTIDGKSIVGPGCHDISPSFDDKVKSVERVID